MTPYFPMRIPGCSSPGGLSATGPAVSSTTVMSKESSGDAAVFDRPISPPSLSWKVDEHPTVSADRCQDLGPASFIVEDNHGPDQDRVEGRYAVQPLHDVGQQTIV